MKADEVLDAIDHALLDYSVSGDAMRWTPDPQGRPSVIVVRGGTPTAQALVRRLDDPEVRERFRVAFTEMAESIARDFIEPLKNAFTSATEALSQLHVSAREAGLLADEPPTEVRQRALWLAQHRNTGPSRDLTMQRRPRKVTA